MEQAQPRSMHLSFAMLGTGRGGEEAVLSPCLFAFIQAEMARKQQRAARFGVEPSMASYAPAQIPEDEVKKQQRAERFGVDYKPAEGLMDIGDLPVAATPVKSSLSVKRVSRDHASPDVRLS